MERETLKSRLGFILLSAGCAIGIGNVWKFPYMAGQGGGGAFVLFYLLFLVILGLPIMTMEFAVGRASRKSPVRAYQVLEKPGQKWHIHGYFTLIGCYLLMMFYTTVAGWMLHYFYMTAAGKLSGLNADRDAGKPRHYDLLDGVRGRSEHSGLRQGPAEWSGACDQGHDDRPAPHHGHSGREQPLHGRRKGGSFLLPGA